MADQDTRLRVLVADDHPIVRTGLSSLISQQHDMVVVAEACSGDAVAALWAAHRPDIGLIDLQMPGLDGIRVIESVRAIDAAATLLILTMYDGNEQIYRALKAGARGYLTKDTMPDELLAAMHRAMRGDVVVPVPLLGKLAERINEREVSQREIEVLQLVASGLSNKDIARCLSIEPSTVKAHLKSVFAKLDAISRTEAVDIGRRRGLLSV